MFGTPKPSDEKKATVPPSETPEIVSPREQELLNRLESETTARKKAEADRDAAEDARKKAETDAAVALDQRDTLRRIQSERPADPAKPAAVKTSSGFSFFRS